MGSFITEIKQIGWATDDIERTIANFEAIGLGGWSEIEKVSPEDYEGMICDDKKQPYSFLVSVNNEFDNIELELIQPLDDYSDYAHFIKKNGGAGIHHISVETDDVEGLRASGHTLLLSGNNKGIPYSWEYYDFREAIGTVLEYFPMDTPPERLED